MATKAICFCWLVIYSSQDRNERAFGLENNSVIPMLINSPFKQINRSLPTKLKLQFRLVARPVAFQNRISSLDLVFSSRVLGKVGILLLVQKILDWHDPDPRLWTLLITQCYWSSGEFLSSWWTGFYFRRMEMCHKSCVNISILKEYTLKGKGL